MSDHCFAKAHSKVKASMLLVFFGITILLLDQFSKAFVYSNLPVIDSVHYWYPYGGIGVFQNLGGIEFSINHMTNAGAAWGVLSNYQLLLVFLRIGLILALCLYLFRYNYYFTWQIPLILIIAGALGNVIDFFIYGHVIDMFHFVLWKYDFPVFNVADCAISLGIFSLFLFSFFEPKKGNG